VEVELGLAGKKRDLKQARKLLQAAGATPSAIGTKLDRALGLMSAENQLPAALAGSTVGELVGGYAAAQCDVLASNDIRFRTGAPVVHPTRVAARRLRSTLRVFGDVADAAAAEELNNELAWYARCARAGTGPGGSQRSTDRADCRAAAGAYSRPGGGRDHQDSG
jgi:inorganic triphosphatase YgiF